MTIDEMQVRIDSLEKRIEKLECFNELERSRKIAELEAENKLLEEQLKRNGILSFEDFLKENKIDF